MLPSLKYKQLLQSHNRQDPPSASRSQAQARPPKHELCECDQCELNNLSISNFFSTHELWSNLLLIDMLQNIFQVCWWRIEGAKGWLDVCAAVVLACLLFGWVLASVMRHVICYLLSVVLDWFYGFVNCDLCNNFGVVVCTLVLVNCSCNCTASVLVLLKCCWNFLLNLLFFSCANWLG